MEKINRSIRVPVPVGLVHPAEDLEEDAHEIATAFTEGAEVLGGFDRRQKHPVLVQDVPQPAPAPMDVDVLAHAMIHQAHTSKELSDKWMVLSERNQLLGLKYTEMIANSLMSGPL